MTIKRLSSIMFVGAWMLSLAFIMRVAAQDDSPPLFTLTSPDPAHPVQFQAIAPGDVPLRAGFTRRLDIRLNTGPDKTVIYTALENTGWSEGVIGLISNALDPDAQYVALEVDAQGAPLPGGLAFELAYNADLDGFVLPVLIAQARTLGIFRVLDAGGMDVTGQTNTRTNGRVRQEPAAHTVDPEPVLAPFVFELHIIARPVPTPTPTIAAVPTPVPGAPPPPPITGEQPHPTEGPPVLILPTATPSITPPSN